jgi:hypothetical protein
MHVLSTSIKSQLVMVQKGSETERALKLLGSKFIKQASSDLVSSPKAEPQEQRGFPYIPFRAGYRIGGYSLSHTKPHAISLAGVK